MNKKKILMTLLLIVTLLGSTSFLVSCGKDDNNKKPVKKFIAEHDKVYQLLPEQSVNIKDGDNQDVVWKVGEDYYVIHGSKLEDLVEAFNKQLEKAEK